MGVGQRCGAGSPAAWPDPDVEPELLDWPEPAAPPAEGWPPDEPDPPCCPADGLPEEPDDGLPDEPDAGLPDEPDGELLPDGIGIAGGCDGDGVCVELAQPATASATLATMPSRPTAYRLMRS